MTIKKAFTEVFKQSMTDLGFSIKGKIFHKIVNDEVVILVSYATFSSYGYKTFTIQYDIIPLCCGYDIDKFMDAYRLNILVGTELSEWDISILDDDINPTEWSINENVFNNMSLALEACKANLFPYLKQITNLKTTLECVYKMHNRFGYQSIPLYFLYLPNLKLHNFEDAKKMGQLILDGDEENLKIYIANWGDIEKQTVKEETEEFLKQKEDFNNICKAIDNDDLKWLDEYLSEKENHSKNTYIKSFCK